MRTILDPNDDAVKRIHSQLAHLANIHRGSTAFSTNVLSKKQLAAVIDTAFWASLIRNEARPTRVRIAVGDSMTANEVLAFNEELDYEERVIAKLAPAAICTSVH